MGRTPVRQRTATGASDLARRLHRELWATHVESRVVCLRGGRPPLRSGGSFGGPATGRNHCRSSEWDRTPWSAAPMASRLSIAVSGGGSPPKPRNRQPNADLPQMTRSSSNCASVLCGWAASISHIGMLESTKVNLGTLARFRSPCAPGQRRGMSTAHRAEPPSTSFRSQSPAGSHTRPEALAGPTPPQSCVRAWPDAGCRTFRGLATALEDAYSSGKCIDLMAGMLGLCGEEPAASLLAGPSGEFDVFPPGL